MLGMGEQMFLPQDCPVGDWVTGPEFISVKLATQISPNGIRFGELKLQFKSNLLNCLVSAEATKHSARYRRSNSNCDSGSAKLLEGTASLPGNYHGQTNVKQQKSMAKILTPRRSMFSRSLSSFMKFSLAVPFIQQGLQRYRS
jgi:hypothetical protein